MNTIDQSRRALSTIFVAALVSLAFPSISRADDADVKAAIEANHAAIHSLNIEQISKVWAHGADVAIVDPNDKSVVVGWDAVKSHWEGLIKVLSAVDITQTEGPDVAVTGDVARAVGIVHVSIHFKSQDPRDVNYVETDVLLKQDGHWLIALHTAKPL